MADDRLADDRLDNAAQPGVAIQPGVAVVCFYRGRAWYDLLTRAVCRRKGQALSDVPSHVAVVLADVDLPDRIRPLLYEMTGAGWHSRPAVPADYAWSVQVSLADARGSEEAALSCRYIRYAWGTDALIGLHDISPRLLPAPWLRWARKGKARICSVFVKAVLEAGGASLPHWLRAQYVPCSPNDIWLALKG